MRPQRPQPADIARRLSARSRSHARADPQSDVVGWRRESFRLPREEARSKAREWFDRFPKAAYMTEVEFWQEWPDGDIEFTLRRLPSAD